MIKIENTIFHKTVTRPYPVLLMTLFAHGFFRKDVWRAVLPIDFALEKYLTIGADIYYSDDYLRDLPKEVTTKMFANKKTFLDIKNKTLLAEKNFIASQRSDYQNFFNALINYVPALGIYHTCDDLIENKLRESILLKTSPKETNQLINTINTPLNDNFNVKMNLELLKNGIDGIDRFIKKYSWFIFRYGKHNFYTKQEAVGMLRHLKEENYLRKYKKEKKRVKEAIKRAKQLLNSKGYYVDIMQFFVYYRTQRTDIFNKLLFEYYDKLLCLATDFNINYQQLLACTYSEIISKNIPSKRILNERSRNFIFFKNENGEQILIGKKRDDFLKKYQNRSEKSDFIKGRVAYRGRVKGVIVLVKEDADLKKIKRDSILITSMTTPNMIQGMKKAIAFVTDEGGITCHAAIVSRELGKPCIIGTKIATKVFKDGDLVEVDANKGVVRRI